METKTKVTSNHKILKFLRKRKIVVLAVCIFCSIVFFLAVDFYVGSFSSDRLFRDINDVPHRRAALVLGCGRIFDGHINLFYLHRINAAVELWNSGKIDAIVVSGDNSRKDYDEPTSMKSDLIARGIPAEYITIDYAGFRTLDSIVRAEKVFNLEDYIIISQPFHCSRAIYLAFQYDQDVLGYCARDVKRAAGLKMRLREVLARNKALVDVLLHKNPKYLGKQEIVNYKA
ncbi:MAG: YdcF family protein [Sedimentisphaerales bacterium]|nr:YdcF family protein [Sedimentisphaerales bacterium]